jgi:hypothetical protein
MQKIKQIASAPKKVARRGRYGLAAGFIAGAVACRNLDNETYKEAMAFIKLKGLTDEFFTATEFDWQDQV